MNATGDAVGVERTYAAVAKSIVGNVEDILRSEVQLAKASAREEVASLTSGLAWLAVAGVAGLIAFGFLLAAIYHLLLYVVPEWGAALIIAGGLLLISIIALAMRSSVVGRLARERAAAAAVDLKEASEWASRRTK